MQNRTRPKPNQRRFFDVERHSFASLLLRVLTLSPLDGFRRVPLGTSRNFKGLDGGRQNMES